jgi:hypothetical protein
MNRRRLPHLGHRTNFDQELRCAAPLIRPTITSMPGITVSCPIGPPGVVVQDPLFASSARTIGGIGYVEEINSVIEGMRQMDLRRSWSSIARSEQAGARVRSRSARCRRALLRMGSSAEAR